MNKFVSFIVFCVCLLATGSAFGYDTELAQRLEQFYQPFEGKGTAKQLHNILVPQFVEAVKANENLFVLDVRVKGETGIYGITLPRVQPALRADNPLIFG